MDENRGRRRVRVVIDEKRHWRHQWKKRLRMVLIVSAWVIGSVLGLLFFWYVLDKMLKPPPME
jgi:hypothetical protein